MDMTADEFPVRVRLRQADYPEGHKALINWGLWSRDRAGIFPIDARPSIWDQFKADENEAWGDTPEVAAGPAEKPERADDDPYDELAGSTMDERLHAPGGPGYEIRLALRVIYVHRAIPEYQYAARAGCSPDALCERLEAGLRFAERFV